MREGVQTMEEWRDVPGYEGLYKVSSIGRVMRCDEYKKKTYKNGKKHRILKNALTPTGYPHVQLYKDNKCNDVNVHRLVSMAFLGRPKCNSHVIDHINRDKTDNRVENLRYVSISANRRNSEISEASSSKFNGVQLYRKLFDARIKINKKNKFIGSFQNEEDAARAFDRYVIEHSLDRVLNFPEEYKEVI
jgi:hypothetical protein